MHPKHVQLMQMQLPGILLPSLLLPPDDQGLDEESDFIKTTLPENFSRIHSENFSGLH
jgi:hypothetical protein